MLRKLTVSNFKRFRDEMGIELDPITVLLGQNNSGKSTVLQALSIFQYCVDVTRKKKNGSLVLEKLTIGPEEFGALPVASPMDLWPGGRPNAGPISIRAEFDADCTVGFEIKLSYNRFSIAPSVTGPAESVIEKARIRYVPIHSGLAPREEYLLAPARADRLRELQHGSVLRNLLWDLKENNKDRWKLLKQILTRLYPAATLDVSFDREVDRFITSEYKDQALSRHLDVVVSGTGFQQVLQIFSSVLAQNSGIVLLDEPDAHLHARLQVELMRVFEDLTRDEGLQFIMATHSPHLLASAPPASLRAMIEGRAHRFATTPEQIDVLDTLGAFDRMEVVPLLRTRAVVFVENREDRKLIECFARQLWDDKKAREVFERVSFLYTYQEPIAADVKRLARQVRDLLNAPDLSAIGGGRPARFLVLGDRDYRPASSLAAKQRQLERDARGQDFGLELKSHIWARNEIENYLLDRKAIEEAVLDRLPDSSQKDSSRKVVRAAFDARLAQQKPQALERVAGQLQRDDRRLTYESATERARAILAAEWGDGTGLADAKRVLSGVRKALQDKKLPHHLSEGEIIAHLAAVPDEIRRVLGMIFRLGRLGPGRRRALTRAPAPR